MKTKQINETIKYTGHPFVDVGVAVLECYLTKPCEEIQDVDLEKASKWVKGLYSRKDMKGYLTVHFPNSGWCNATIGKDKKEEYMKNVLSSYIQSPLIPQRTCAFCDRPANFLADRQHIPLLTGMTLLVTAPSGIVGLPVCGYCLCSVQFYPLGTLKVAGRPLFWWTPEPELTYELVKDYYYRVKKLLVGSSEKFPNLSWPRTRLLESARDVLEHLAQDKAFADIPLADCIGYHITNYGSGPDFDQFIIPKTLLEFWLAVRSASSAVREAHQWVEQTAWEIPKQKKKTDRSEADPDSDNTVSTRKNYYYEALGGVFQNINAHKNIGSIVPRFFLQKKPENFHRNNFELCELFLKRMGCMEKQRLEIIKNVADKIINILILGNNESQWLANLYNRELRPREFLGYLVRVGKRLSLLKESLSYDDICLMLNLSSIEEVPLIDTWLVRDLLLIRMLEQVGQRKSEMLTVLTEEKETVSE